MTTKGYKTVNIKEEDWKKLSYACIDLGLNKSELLHLALEKYLEDHKVSKK